MLEVKQSATISAKPERMWRAIIKEISKWWTAPYFMDVDRATGLAFEPRVGGRFLETWGKPGSGYVVGHIVERLPPERLGFTWMESAGGGVSTVVWIDLIPKGQATGVTLTHQGFERLPKGEDQRAGYDAGRADLLERLKSYIEQGRPRKALQRGHHH